MRRMRLTKALTALGITALAVVACKGTWATETEISSIVGSGRFSMQHHEPPGSYTIAELPPGCDSVDVTFTDGNGNPVAGGGEGLGVGDSFPTPAGATHIHVSGPSSSGSGGNGGGSVNATHSQKPTSFVKPDYYFGVTQPIRLLESKSAAEWNEGSNKFLTVHYDSPTGMRSKEQIVARLLKLLMAPDPTTVGMGRWEVDQFHFAEPVTSAGVLVGGNVHSWDNVLTSLNEWPVYTLVVNGTTVPQTQETEANGWTHRMSYVDGSLAILPGFNQAGITTQDVNDPIPLDFTASALFN